MQRRGARLRIETGAGTNRRQTGRDFAAALDAVAALDTEDVMLLPPGEPLVVGRAAIEASWQGFLDAHPHDVGVETIDARSSGSLGYETGRFIEILRKGADGKWYSTHGIWNNDPAEE